MADTDLFLNGPVTKIGEMMIGTADALTVKIGEEIVEVMSKHAIWAASCDSDKTWHFDTDLPCDDFERAAALALTWLLDNIPIE